MSTMSHIFSQCHCILFVSNTYSYHFLLNVRDKSCK